MIFYDQVFFFQMSFESLGASKLFLCWGIMVNRSWGIQTVGKEPGWQCKNSRSGTGIFGSLMLLLLLLLLWIIQCQPPRWIQVPVNLIQVEQKIYRHVNFEYMYMYTHINIDTCVHIMMIFICPHWDAKPFPVRVATAGL